MSDRDDGGPVYPQEEKQVAYRYGHEDCAQKVMSSMKPGISLRQYYAGLAMQGFASDSMYEPESQSEMAKTAVAWADALIAELKR